MVSSLPPPPLNANAIKKITFLWQHVKNSYKLRTCPFEGLKKSSFLYFIIQLKICLTTFWNLMQDNFLEQKFRVFDTLPFIMWFDLHYLIFVFHVYNIYKQCSFGSFHRFFAQFYANTLSCWLYPWRRSLSVLKVGLLTV